MMQKVTLFACLLAITQGGIIGTDYSPANAVSTVYSSIGQPLITNAVIGKTIAAPITYTKTYPEPAPVYEAVVSTQDNNHFFDGRQHMALSKYLDSAYSNINNFEPQITSIGVPYTVPTFYSSPAVHSSILTSPESYVSTPSISVKSVSTPITHTTPLVTKTVSSPIVTSYSTPILSKSLTTGLSAYASQAPAIQTPLKTTVTYSESPVVSHMSFNGLGTSYSW